MHSIESGLPSDHPRLAVNARARESASIGERLTWPRAALFVLTVSAILWYGLWLLVLRVTG